MSDLPNGWTEGPLLEIVDLHDSRRIPLNATERAKRRGKYPYYGANGKVDTIDGYLFEGDFVLLAEKAYPSASGTTKCWSGRVGCDRTNHEHDGLRWRG